MFKNYFKIALRSLRRNKAFTAINIAGLALGIASCLLIVLYVQHQLSYDRYNKKADRIVRVVLKGKMQVGELKESHVMPPVAAAFKKDFPEIEEATRIRAYGTPRITYKDKTFKEDEIAFVDSNFFRVFTVPLIKGDPNTALANPNTLVISKAVAKRYFGDEDPIGKVLQFKDNKAAATVTGLFDEIPANSHFHFGLLISMSSFPEAKDPSWITSNYYTYLVLPEHYDYKKLEAKLPAEFDKYVGPQMEKAMHLTIQQFKKNGNSIGLYLQPLTDIHLHSDFTGDMEPHGDIRYVYIYSAVALFMLLIACINFMNLSTASASKRAKEVGVRKVMGSVKGQLVRQFLVESLLLTVVALAIALALVSMALPFFNDLTGQHLGLHLTSNPWILPGLILFGLITGLLAGSYPAFFLSSFNPITVLKGKLTTGKKTAGLRSGLVVFQFFISISLMVGAMVVYRQLSYIRHKDLGYSKDQVLIVHEAWWLRNNTEAFRQQLLRDPRVISVSASGFLPAGPSYDNNFFAYSDGNSSQMIKNIRYDVDDNYIPTLGMSMADGRNFSKEYASDSNAVIVNESAVSAFGWKGSVLGHTITHSENDGAKTTYHVIGVVKNFHFRSLHEQITPLVMTRGEDWNNLIIKTRTKDIAGLLTTLRRRWSEMTTESAFSYSFLDQRFDNTYKSDRNIGLILGIFAGLTIFIACLGLFGLATFTAAQRTKEIGIRKVLGADISGLVTLLSKEFLKLVGVSFLIAAPFTWWVMNRWLQDFAYRSPISWWIFPAAAILALLVALVTISSQAIKTALTNPVNSLRAE
ncbi:ABC transporter permease [Flavitalea sp. BT771]|uniref:ABC transporter permease n=1 Tax=Flavitalea sp. BT771 TaxID=3063329 RepID=UPI0026E3349B|nr:ABC transporter permease [Flavitalea sp. BT771]MDO6434857.1 ABC transporter permease [Flavitalea sp. BT771]MDV6223757.1 ABC transporter permease [Flavitalea sp. BT771]